MCEQAIIEEALKKPTLKEAITYAIAQAMVAETGKTVELNAIDCLDTDVSRYETFCGQYVQAILEQYRTDTYFVSGKCKTLESVTQHRQGFECLVGMPAKFTLRQVKEAVMKEVLDDTYIICSITSFNKV